MKISLFGYETSDDLRITLKRRGNLFPVSVTFPTLIKLILT